MFYFNRFAKRLIFFLGLASISIAPVKAQNYLEFNSSYYNCGLAIQYSGEIGSQKCRLVFTYDGSNLNFHFFANSGKINFITTNLNSNAVSINNGALYMSSGVYNLDYINLTYGGRTIEIYGKGECRKSANEIACSFVDQNGNEFAGVAF